MADEAEEGARRATAAGPSKQADKSLLRAASQFVFFDADPGPAKKTKGKRGRGQDDGDD